MVGEIYVIVRGHRHIAAINLIHKRGPKPAIKHSNKKKMNLREKLVQVFDMTRTRAPRDEC
jgi:hypothetical protein